MGASGPGSEYCSGLASIVELGLTDLGVREDQAFLVVEPASRPGHHVWCGCGEEFELDMPGAAVTRVFFFPVSDDGEARYTMRTRPGCVQIVGPDSLGERFRAVIGALSRRLHE